MTIAMCYLAPEGVVLGADSTSSAAPEPGGFHFFNHNQKLFEIGEGSTLGLLTWGLGGLPGVSHRTLAAQLGDALATKEAKSVEEVASRWADLVWQRYSAVFKNEIARATTLNAKSAFDPAKRPPDPNTRTKKQEQEFESLMGNYVGFCIAGYTGSRREPSAYTVEFSPLLNAQPKPEPVVGLGFWGAQNFIIRTLAGFDSRLLEKILSSGLWKGTGQQLLSTLTSYNLRVPSNLPIRDAVDFVHSSIHSTIKALKFSNLNQICGGPIEIAVITTDRRFRWVRHKEWDAAILEGETL